MTPATPTLSEPITIAGWWKNRGSQAIRVTLSTYENRNLIDLRRLLHEQANEAGTCP